METGGIYLGSAREREEQFRVNRVESKAVQPVGTLPKKSANETMEGGETETIKTGERGVHRYERIGKQNTAMSQEETQQTVETQPLKRPNGSTSTGSETVRKHRKNETPKREGVSEASGKEQRRRTTQRSSSSEDSDSDDERSGASATTIEYIELSSDDMDEG